MKVEMEFHSVKDKLPKLDKENDWRKYLCRITTRVGGAVDCTIESYDIIKFSNESNKDGEFEQVDDIWEITHWSELPKIKAD